MNRKIFIELLEKSDDRIDKQWIFKVLQRSIDAYLYDGNPKGHRNLIIVMEELAELTKEVSKTLREKGDEVGVLEELADVQLCIYYVQEICGISNTDLNKAINVKAKRIENELDKNGKYQ